MTEIRVHYPRLQVSQMQLATDLDGWQPAEYAARYDARDRESPCYVFRVEAAGPFFFKPVLRLPNGEWQWSVGKNYRAPEQVNLYPYFDSSERSQVYELWPFRHGRHEHAVQLYLPPGHADNLLKRYPVLVLHETQPSFRSGWDLRPVFERLMQAQVIDKVVVVAVADAGLHLAESNFPSYRNFLLGVLDALENEARLLPGGRNAGVLGSSLGALTSLALALDRPDRFGHCAALSPGRIDWMAESLLHRIAELEEVRCPRFYLEAGQDEEVREWTGVAHQLLVSRGFTRADCWFVDGPTARHGEWDWGERIHLPLQFMFGAERPAWVQRTPPPSR